MVSRLKSRFVHMEMHKTAEYGIAAHWKYKENITGEGDNEEQKISWLRQILEWQRDLSDNHENS